MSMDCSFCGKAQHEVARLIAGPSVAICSECIELCNGILGGNVAFDVAAPSPRGQAFPPPSPHEVMVRLPDGSAHVCKTTSPWSSIEHGGGDFEWCAAESAVRGRETLRIVAVRRERPGSTVVGRALGPGIVPTEEHARGVIDAQLGAVEGELEAAAERLASRDWLAAKHVVFVRPDGTRRMGQIAIGRPERTSGAEFQCWASLEGIEAPAPIAGNSAWQALTLGVRHLADRLARFQQDGGKVLDVTTLEDAAVHEIFGAWPGVPSK